MAKHTITCRCGSTDFKTVKENVQQTYKQCRSCGWNFALEEFKNPSISEWVQSLQLQYSEAKEALNRAVLRLNEKETNLTLAVRNAAQREVDRVVLQLEIANQLAKIVEATEEGQITLLIPEVGKYTFTWGDFKLFKVLGNEKNT